MHSRSPSIVGGRCRGGPELREKWRGLVAGGDIDDMDSRSHRQSRDPVHDGRADAHALELRIDQDPIQMHASRAAGNEAEKIGRASWRARRGAWGGGRKEEEETRT